MYKAKLAEQAERCARMNASNRSARVDKEWDGRRRVGTTAGCLVDDGARRAEATERVRPRARARETTARAIDRARRASSRVDSDRFDSIDRSNERPNEWARRSNERTIDVRRVMRVDARITSRASTRARVVGGEGGGERAMKGGSTRPRVPARIEGGGARARAREAEGTRPNRSGVRREATDDGGL